MNREQLFKSFDNLLSEYSFEYSDIILEHKDWYNRVIPNSSWLLNYLEFKKEENEK
jgi:hypothetical protein